MEYRLYIQALEFTADGEIEKAIKLLEALLLVDPSHKKGKELLDKLKRKEKIKRKETEDQNKTKHTYEAESHGMFIRFLKFLWRHIPFLIILGIASYLFYLAYGAKTSWGISILLGFIVAFIIGYLYLWYFIFVEVESGQIRVLLMILGGVIIFLLFKYLVVPFIWHPFRVIMWIEIPLRVFVFLGGAAAGGGLGYLVRRTLSENS